MAEIEIPKPVINQESTLIRPNSVNNFSPKTEKKEPKKPKVTQKDLTFSEKLKRSFVKEDLKDIGNYVIFEVVIPSIKRTAFDMVVGSASQIFGVSIPRNIFGYSSNGYNPRINRLTAHERQYRDYSSISKTTQPSTSIVPSYNTRFYAQDFPFDFLEEAQACLEFMMDFCDRDGWVTVGKFFEFADPDGTLRGKNPYTNYDYGWSNLNGVEPKFVGDGYVLNLPPARPRR